MLLFLLFLLLFLLLLLLLFLLLLLLLLLAVAAVVLLLLLLLLLAVAHDVRDLWCNVTSTCHRQNVTIEAITEFFEKVCQSDVADVSIARDNTQLVNLLIKHGSLKRQLEVIDDTISERVARVRMLHWLLWWQLCFLRSVALPFTCSRSAVSTP
jgi:hypothetical protein